MTHGNIMKKKMFISLDIRIVGENKKKLLELIYDTLLNAQDKKVTMLQCQKSFDNVPIKELLEGFNMTELRSLLVNNKFEEFKQAIAHRFSDISYQIHKSKPTESYFHSVFHTILSENGLNPVSEESTNDGRIDLHLTIGKVKYLFELKVNESAESALEQISDKQYYQKFKRDFKEILLVGVNFNSKTRNIDAIKAQKA